jgi:hypothetical protein
MAKSVLLTTNLPVVLTSEGGELAMNLLYRPAAHSTEMAAAWRDARHAAVMRV